MADEFKTYQPKWEEQKNKKHHHHFHSGSSEKNKRYGGALRMKDRQAYYGLMCLVAAFLIWGAYKVFRPLVKELREMPNDDPTTEMVVDELRIRKVAEIDAIQLGDSLAQAYNLDSMKRKVHIETRPVYRPPRRENEWYITKREWKKIWKEFKIMQWEWKHDKEENERKKEEG